jgi:hypothetical protein
MFSNYEENVRKHVIRIVHGILLAKLLRGLNI